MLLQKATDGSGLLGAGSIEQLQGCLAEVCYAGCEDMAQA